MWENKPSPLGSIKKLQGLGLSSYKLSVFLGVEKGVNRVSC